MSETTTPAATPADPAAAIETALAEADKPLGEGGEKALKAERSRASAAEKERDALKAELDKIAAANLSDLERAQKEAAEATANAAKAQADALRYRVAAKNGISEEDAELFLTGTDEETLNRQAARLVERTPTTVGPRPDPTQGYRGGPPALNGDPLLDDLKNRLGI